MLLHLAEENPDRKILLVSTDPAHSLGDSLDQPIGDRTVSVTGIDNLFARETDAQRLLTEFKLANGPVLAKIADRGTYFDKDDIQSFFELSLPGMDEFMAILELMELVKTRQFDAIIMDTAPTGHTIRLLGTAGTSATVGWHLGPDDEETPSDGRGPSRVAVINRTNATDGWSVWPATPNVSSGFFRTRPLRNSWSWTIPEEMAVAESERLVAALRKFRIPVQNLIVNHVVEQNPACPFCQERCDEQASSMERIERAFADLHILRIHQLPREVRGLESLKQFARLFSDGELAETVEDDGKSEQTKDTDVRQSGLPLPLPTTRLVLIGGKGGVGKSTIAAATALEIAARFPEKRVLIFSTDPAHSLSDSFGQRIGTEITAIEGTSNLSAQEIDAAKLLVDFKLRYRESIDEVFDSFLSGSNVNMELDQDVMEHLLDLSPPGIDEVMALIEVMELMEGHAFDIFVLDTAPTGHLLRFLEMPEIAGDWLGAAMKVILKYQGLVSLGSVAGLVMKYAGQIKKLRKTLLDAVDTEILVVTIPEAMGVVEMRRLLESLHEFKIACRQIVVNMVTPLNTCKFCTVKREEEQRYIREVVTKCSDHRVACVPRLPHPIHGLPHLVTFRRVLWGDVANNNPNVPSMDLTSSMPSRPMSEAYS